nr:immunoglobulin heavy chain junction region [Mus musculus]
CARLGASDLLWSLYAMDYW